MPRSDEELSGLRKVLTLQMVKHWRPLVVLERPSLLESAATGEAGTCAAEDSRRWLR